MLHVDNYGFIIGIGERIQVLTEVKALGLSWEEAQAKARDRVQWQQTTVAICPIPDEEDEVNDAHGTH